MITKNARYFGLTLLALLLNACVSGAPKHTPYIVNLVDQRAQVIAKQTDNTLRPPLVVLALSAYNNAQKAGFGNKHLFSIIDYSLPSTANRLWVIDLDNNQVIFSEKVAHGIGSGELYATRFSDQIDSKETSIGMYMTTNNGYKGRHGYALRLKGLEPGFNDLALKRAIVLHSATYVSDDFIHIHGYIGQTWGCPAINGRNLRGIINTLKGGTLIFAYANDPLWLKHSRFLAHPSPNV